MLQWNTIETDRVGEKRMENGKQESRAGFNLVTDNRAAIAKLSSTQMIPVSRPAQQRAAALDVMKTPNPVYHPFHSNSSDGKIIFQAANDKIPIPIEKKTDPQGPIQPIKITNTLNTETVDTAKSRFIKQMNNTPLVPARSLTPVVTNIAITGSSQNLSNLIASSVTFQSSSSCLHIPNHIKKKLSWHIDSAALIHRPKFKDLMNLINEKGYVDDIRLQQSEGTLLQLSHYFELLIQRTFTDHKMRFLSNPYFRSLFAEELGRDKDKDPLIKRSTIFGDDSAKQTPVEMRSYSDQYER